MRIAVVIPARMGSTRFPGKPLIDLAGKPMVQWVVEAANRAEIAQRVVVATPDQEILDVCARFGAEAVLTSSAHATGTDRIAEAAQMLDAEIFLNVQGDEPLIDPATIRACAEPLLSELAIEMSSVYSGCTADEAQSPAVVKVVTDREGFALYFSRFPIPFRRNEPGAQPKKHIGIYGFTRQLLARFTKWPMGDLEQAESLEQLRFLENGVKIRMVQGESSGLAVDTPEQADTVRRLLAQR